MASSKADSLKAFYGMTAAPNAPEDEPAPAPTLEERTATQSLSELLALSSEKLDAVRDLYADRQSLVYNHHQELVGASETVGEMRRGIEALKPRRASLEEQLAHMRQQPTEPLGASAPKDALPWAEQVAPVVELPLKLRRILDERKPTSVADAEAALQAQAPVLAAWVDAHVAGADELQRLCHDMIVQAHTPST